MQTKEALLLLNQWWLTHNVESSLKKEFKRDQYNELRKLVSEPRGVVIVSGLRRVGKSTLIYQIIDEILQTEKPERVLYFSYDFSAGEITEILNAYQSITNVDWKHVKVTVFLDEIQKHKNWSSEIKILYDLFPRLKFVVTGSASLQLERDASIDLAGRYLTLEIPVLSIVEYYSIKTGRPHDNLELIKPDIKNLLDEYMLKPFPELVNVSNKQIISEYIRETVIAKIVALDIAEEFKKVDIQLILSLLDYFLSEPGIILNVDKMSQNFGKRKEEINRHVGILEYSKLIRILKNYRPSTLSESRKMRKVYPYDISLSLAEYPSIEYGKIIETKAITTLCASRYWRDGNKEVDCILLNGREMIPVEVKSGNAVRDEHLTGIKYFIKKFRVNKSILIYLGEDQRRDQIELKSFINLLISSKNSISGEGHH
ncbi:MAG: ATP-binding protein [Thermoplasmata archaeon]